MNSDWLPIQAIEPVEVFATDGGGAPITGMLNLYAAVRRQSDGFWLDFADMTYKAAGWFMRQFVMTEFDPVLSPGCYRFTLDTSAQVAPDTYYTTIQQVPATVFPQTLIAEVRVGGVPDDCVSSRKALLNRQEIAPGDTGNLVIYDDGGLVPWRTANVTGPSGEAIAIPSATPTKRSEAV